VIGDPLQRVAGLSRWFTYELRAMQPARRMAVAAPAACPLFDASVLFAEADFNLGLCSPRALDMEEWYGR